MVIAREGRARVLLVKGEPAKAAAMLAGADDLKSLVTLGAALYATRDFQGALAAFERVVDEDPELIAGAVTRIGSVVYDGSLATALTKLREQLISE